MTFQTPTNTELPHIAIISSGRPKRVQEMKHHLGHLSELTTWYVGDGEKADYEYAGARVVVESGLLCPSRNLALERAFEMGKVCVQLSDDLTGIDWCNDRQTKHRITLERAIRLVAAGLSLGSPAARLAGAAATDNSFFMPKDDVSRHVFIIGDFMAVAPNPIRFDENLHLKEDLDYSIEHLKLYGQVARVNTVLAGWQHRTNLGGAVQYRTAAGEQEAIAYISAKHPGWVRENTARANELLLVYPPKEAAAEVVSPLRGS